MCTVGVGGRIAESWSVAGERPTSLDPPAGTGTATRAQIAERCEAWSPMWNGDVDLAHDLVTGDFRIWFGARRAADDGLRGPDALAAYVRGHRAGRVDLFFAKHREPVIDVERQRAAFTWTATQTRDGRTVTVGGIDLFALVSGRFAAAWSVTGSHPF